MYRNARTGLGLFTILMFLACAGGGRYQDVITVYTQFTDAMEEYLINLEKAGDAPSVARAIDTYAQKMEDWAPALKRIKTENPDWDDPSKMPDEIKPLNAKAERLAKALAGTFIKTMQYIDYPEVRKANGRLQRAMMKMQ